jgi:hypothetical protein
MRWRPPCPNGDDGGVTGAATSSRARDERQPALPRRRTTRLKILDGLAGQFQPGQKYTEATVNAVLGTFHPDYCALRRYLLEEGFMDRDGGLYWRSGGTFNVD